MELQPAAAQTASNSHLDAAVRHINHFWKSGRPSGSSSSSSSFDPSEPLSGSSDSESSSDLSDDESSGSESGRGHPRRKQHCENHHSRHKHCQRAYSSMRTIIKPIPPKEYDSAADVRAYHCFIRESDAYLWDGKVRGHRKVFLLLYYLTDKVYNFYTQKVAINEEQWTVSLFFLISVSRWITGCSYKNPGSLPSE